MTGRVPEGPPFGPEGTGRPYRGGRSEEAASGRRIDEAMMTMISGGGIVGGGTVGVMVGAVGGGVGVGGVVAGGIIVVAIYCCHCCW